MKELILFFYSLKENRGTLHNNRFYKNILICVYTGMHPSLWTLWLVMETSSENLIYRNNFCNNSHQAHDDSNNLWDNGYPSGGNYWSDYNGVDQYHSPTQGILQFGWSTPLYQNENFVSLKNYPRYENPYCNTPFESDTIHIQHNSSSLELNFKKLIRSEKLLK